MGEYAEDGTFDQVGEGVLYGEYHRFRSDYGGIDFGHELDIGLTYAWNENTALRFQHARYDPGAATTDPRIRKTWITFTWKY